MILLAILGTAIVAAIIIYSIVVNPMEKKLKRFEDEERDRKYKRELREREFEIKRIKRHQAILSKEPASINPVSSKSNFTNSSSKTNRDDESYYDPITNMWVYENTFENGHHCHTEESKHDLDNSDSSSSTDSSHHHYHSHYDSESSNHSSSSSSDYSSRSSSSSYDSGSSWDSGNSYDSSSSYDSGSSWDSGSSYDCGGCDF